MSAQDNRNNRYPGVNPHLNSFLQHKSGWKGFHAKHIAHISETLDRVLPEGYYTADEESLQIGIYDRDSQYPFAKAATVPDVAIYRRGLTGQTQQEPSMTSTPTLTMPLVDDDEEEEYIGSAVIYKMEKGEFPGKPVTRVEVLSPANKPSGSHYDKYTVKREQALRTGLRLLEIDYLHERGPIDPRIPNYPERHKDATPYSIIVSDPRPVFAQGIMTIYGFGILDPLPIIAVPLDGEDTIQVDFGAIYDMTFESSRLFRDVLVDYAQEPVNFEAYSPTDQQVIRNFIASLVRK